MENTTVKKRTQSRKSKKEYDKFVKGFLKLEKPNIILCVSDMVFDVEANPDVYSKTDVETLRELMNSLAKKIWIDRTYVKFNGNRWKDAFIVEEKWYDFVRFVVGSDLGRKKYKGLTSKMCSDVITEAVAMIAIEYLYRVLEKYGYKSEDIEILPDEKKNRVTIEYDFDNRTEWRF